MTSWLLRFLVVVGLVVGALLWLNQRPYHVPSGVTAEKVRLAVGLAAIAEPQECTRRTPLGELVALDPAAREQVDGWGRPLWMHCVNGQFEVRSAGADGQLDTADDVFESSRMLW